MTQQEDDVEIHMLHLAKGGNQHPFKLLSPEMLKFCYKPAILRFAALADVHLQLAIEDTPNKGSNSTILFSFADTNTMGKLTDGKHLTTRAEAYLRPAQGCEIRLIPQYEHGIKDKTAHTVDLVLSLDYREVRRWQVQIFHPHYGPRIYRQISTQPGYQPASRAFYRTSNGSWAEDVLLPEFGPDMNTIEIVPARPQDFFLRTNEFDLHNAPPPLELPASLQSCSTDTKESLEVGKRGLETLNFTVRKQRKDALKEKEAMVEREALAAKEGSVKTIAKNRPQRRRHGFCLEQHPSMITALQLLTEEYYRIQASRQSARLQRKSGSVKTERLGSTFTDPGLEEVEEECLKESSGPYMPGSSEQQADFDSASSIWAGPSGLPHDVTLQTVRDLMPASLAPSINWRASELLEDCSDASLFDPLRFSSAAPECVALRGQ